MALYNLLKKYIWGIQVIQNKTNYTLAESSICNIHKIFFLSTEKKLL